MCKIIKKSEENRNLLLKRLESLRGPDDPPDSFFFLFFFYPPDVKFDKAPLSCYYGPEYREIKRKE